MSSGDQVSTMFQEGLRLLSGGNPKGALSLFSQVYALDPRSGQLLNAMSAAHFELKHWKEAAHFLEQAKALQPELPITWNNLGLVYEKSGDLEKALLHFEKATELDPKSVPTLLSLAKVAYALGRFDQVVSAYDQVLQLDFQNLDAKISQGLALLAQEPNKEAWQSYEWRLEARGAKKFHNETLWPYPKWKGEDLSGKSILVVAEQGLGDCFHFGRYLPVLAEKGAGVVFLAPEKLKVLFEKVPGIAEVCAVPPAEVFDYWISLCSLPLHLNPEAPWVAGEGWGLGASSSVCTEMGEKLKDCVGLKVGINWEINTLLAGSNTRSVPLDLWVPLLEVGGISLVSLQYDEGETLAAHPRFSKMLNPGNQLSFEQTAGVIANLDLVISVDTGLAHLAASLGCETWVLVPFATEWRWVNQLAGKKWYDKVRVFRQTQPGQWEDVLAQVKTELEKRV